jgi:hypothetical protein
MTYEYLPSLYACVMLGDGRATRRLACRLFWTYHLTSHVLSPRKDILSRVTPWVIHHRLPEGATDEIATLALRHLAAELQGYDRQPILVLSPRVEDMLSEESLARLESCYLLCREDDLDALFATATYDNVSLCLNVTDYLLVLMCQHLLRILALSCKLDTCNLSIGWNSHHHRQQSRKC